MVMSSIAKSEQLEGIENITDAKEESDKALSALFDYAEKNDIIMISFIGTYFAMRYNPAMSVSANINIRDEFGFEKILNEIKEKCPDYKNKKVHLLINSTGGSVMSSYKITRIIRTFFSDITVFVPHYALSGGTLLALSGDRIRMGMMSQLSPLDPQIYYAPAKQFVSINSLFEAQDTLNKIFRTSKPEELPYPYKHMAEKLDPAILEHWAGIKNEMIFYLKEILKLSNYNEEEKNTLVEFLTKKFPTHSFVLHYDHAKELGIKVEKENVDLEAWNNMRKWLSFNINKATDRHIIRYIVPKGQTKTKSRSK